MQYQFVMLSDTPYTPLKDVLSEMRRNQSTENPKSPGIPVDPLGSRGLVAVEAYNKSNGHSYKWSLQIFQ